MKTSGDALNEFLERKRCPHEIPSCKRALCNICWNEDVAEWEAKVYKRGFKAGVHSKKATK